MNNEFKKTIGKDQTVYTLESASGGGPSSGSIASVSTSLGSTRKRGDNILAQEAGKEKDAPKPRNFVAKNAKMGGAGQHKDKKKAEKQGDVKHRKPFAEQGVAEGLHPMVIDDVKKLATLNPVDRYSAYANIRDYFKADPALSKMASDLMGGYYEADMLRGKYKTDAAKAKYAELEPMHQAFIKQAIGQEQGVAEGSEQEKPIKKSDWFDPTDMRSPEKQKAAYLNHLAAKKKNKNIKEQGVAEEWSQKYKSSINCSHPKGFSQKAHCAGKKKHNESMMTMEMVCEDCGMCQTHGNLSEIKKGQKDSNGVTKCWPGKHAVGTKKGKNGGQVRNCVPNEGVSEDHEIQMASSELQSIAKNAQALLHMVRKYSEQEGLDAWQQSKITKAADYLNAVLQSISGEQNPLEGVGIPSYGVGGYRNRGDDERHDLDDPELQRNRQEVTSYNITINGKPINPKPIFGRSATIAWGKEQVAAGADLSNAVISPVREGVAEGLLNEFANDNDDDDYDDEEDGFPEMFEAPFTAVINGKKQTGTVIIYPGEVTSAEWHLKDTIYIKTGMDNVYNTSDFITHAAEYIQEIIKLDGRGHNYVKHLKRRGQGVAEGEEDPQSELKLINQKLKDAYKQVRNNSSVSIGWYMSEVKALKARREELIKQLRQGVAEGDAYIESLNVMLERQLEPTMDLDTWNNNFQNADPQKYHQFKNKTPEKKK